MTPIKKLKAIAAKRTPKNWHTEVISFVNRKQIRNIWTEADPKNGDIIATRCLSEDAEFIAMVSNCFDEMLAVIEHCKTLANNVDGLLKMSEDVIRADAGNTNYQCSRLSCDNTLENIKALHAKIKTELGE